MFTKVKSPEIQPSDVKGSSRTKITVKFDCGFNNFLSIRGEGIPKLSWEKGTPLKNIKADEWVFETDQPFPKGEFKILINDNIYESGPNHSITSGKSIQFTPYF